MYKTASRFLNRTHLSPSAIGIGPKARHGPFVAGHIEKLERYMRAAGCGTSIVDKFKAYIRSGKTPGFAVSAAIREMRPDLFRVLRSQNDIEPNWNFRKLLKEYARRQEIANKASRPERGQYSPIYPSSK